MPGREERKAANEAYFRDLNERVEEQVKEFAGDDATFNVLCECSSMGCVRRIAVTPAEYDETHGDPRHFIVVHGHVDAEIEDLVNRTDRYEVVRKRGRAAVVAEEAADT